MKFNFLNHKGKKGDKLHEGFILDYEGREDARFHEGSDNEPQRRKEAKECCHE